MMKLWKEFFFKLKFQSAKYTLEKNVNCAFRNIRTLQINNVNVTNNIPPFIPASWLGCSKMSQVFTEPLAFIVINHWSY